MEILVIRLVFVRELFRDLVLVILRRSLFVRCAYFLRVFGACRRDATRSGALGEMPLYCAVCDPHGVVVGRWKRAPQWASRARKNACIEAQMQSTTGTE